MCRRNIIKLIVAVLAIGGASGYLLYSAFETSWVYYRPVDEFAKLLEQGGKESERLGVNQLIRLIGEVKQGSIVKDVDKMQLSFELSGEKSSIKVQYSGSIPSNFEDGKEVVVEGRVNPEGIFEAVQILTRCESKYKVRLQQEFTDLPQESSGAIE